LANKLSSAPSSKTLVKAITQPQSHSSSSVRHLEEEQGTTTRMDKYIRNMHAMNQRTAYEYYLRLTNFQEFAKINEGAEDPYDILNGYVSYLQTNIH
jgi:hypothetical protein